MPDYHAEITLKKPIIYNSADLGLPSDAFPTEEEAINWALNRLFADIASGDPDINPFSKENINRDDFTVKTTEF